MRFRPFIEILSYWLLIGNFLWFTFIQLFIHSLLSRLSNLYQVQASLTVLSFSSALSMISKPVFLNDILVLENKIQVTQDKSNLISISVFCIQISKISLHLNTDMLDMLWISIRENQAYGQVFKFWLFRLPQLPACLLEVFNFISGMLFHWHLVSKTGTDV